MRPGVQISFPPFRLDLGNECLWRGTQSIALKPKDFAVLRCLVDQPGQLVTKQELLDTVWSGTTVSDGVLKVCIRRLRRALGGRGNTAPVHRYRPSTRLSVHCPAVFGGRSRAASGRLRPASARRPRAGTEPAPRLVRPRPGRCPSDRVRDRRGRHWQNNAGRGLFGSGRTPRLGVGRTRAVY